MIHPGSLLSSVLASGPGCSTMYRYSPHRTGNRNPLWPRLTRQVLPNYGGNPNDTSRIYDRLQRLRRFRNRVFHHEPIMLKGNPLDVHADLCEVLHWISPELNDTIGHLDWVEDVYRDGFDHAKQVIDGKLSSASSQPPTAAPGPSTGGTSTPAPDDPPVP